MAQNSLVYALQAARCRLVLGKEASLLNPWERNLFRDLQYSGNMNTQEIYDQSLLIFENIFSSEALQNLLLSKTKIIFSTAYVKTPSLKNSPH